MLTLEAYYVGTDVFTNTIHSMSKNTSPLSWTRRVRFEKMGFHAESMPNKTGFFEASQNGMRIEITTIGLHSFWRKDWRCSTNRMVYFHLPQ
jgi:hypothetical protein